MKIRVTLKDSDTMPDAVEDAVKREPKPDGISREARADRIKGSISKRFMQYGEYLEVDFVVNDDGEVESATVIPLK